MNLGYGNLEEMQERKSELVEEMLAGEGASLSKMSKEDLLDLLT